MTPHRIFLSLLTVLAFAVPSALAAQESAERHLVLGTAPVAGRYYPVGGALCRLVNADREQHGLRCLIEATAGAEENLRRLRDGDLQFALVQSDWQYHAYRSGLGQNGGAPFEELRAVLSLQAVPFTLLTAPDSGIEGLEDLEGKRLNLGPPETPWRAIGDFLVESLGWDEDDFAAVGELGLDEQAAGLCDGRIDATVLPTGHPSALVAEAAETCGARLVPVNGKAVKRLLSEWAFYAPAVIPGGLYPNNPDPVPSFGLRATLVTRADLAEETVYQATKAVFERLGALKAQHAVLAGLEAEGMVTSGNTAPLHEGALRYYRERGWIATE
jgi:TRAP transporter TAXI family solute receptor